MSLTPNWSDLGEPRPRSISGPYTAIAWPQCDDRIVFVEPIADSFDALSAASCFGRRTCRTFLTMDRGEWVERLGAMLALVGRVQDIGHDELGFHLTRRGAPSAGAIHPIHIVLNLPYEQIWRRYCPMSHSLISLRSQLTPTEVRTSARELLDAPRAALVQFIAEPGMTASKYDDGQSLVWRDAGALQASICFAAQVVGLGVCLLGLTGERWARRLVDQAQLHGVGLAFLGRAPAQEGNSCCGDLGPVAYQASHGPR